MSQKPEENRHPQDDVTDESRQGEEQREESVVEGVVEEELPDNSAAFEQRVEALEAELSDAKDQALRAAAEAQNSRRRAAQDVEKARKFALEKFVKDLLPVADSLEKALDTMQSQGTEDVHLEGVKMTRDMLQSTLQKQGVEVFDPQGEPFDPQYHEAMTMVPNPEVEPNTVIDVMQKGYSLNGRVVRPAMVVVSKAP
ncbi:nucleotide exchange factor GrpE [Carnimonas nigrificans]|uniref:nucleotide exchange factor GrpE n=1 Tax=Carnimonas nigrificans TaxID=64323 RepID=UPI0004BA8F7C|nr:nucleotide exchange factor GrpE [Carnimonas nigrificans]